MIADLYNRKRDNPKYNGRKKTLYNFGPLSNGGKNGVLSGIEGKSPGKYKYRLNYYTDVLS